MSYGEQYMHLGNSMFKVTTSARWGNAYPLQQLHHVHVRRLTRYIITATRTGTYQQLQGPSNDQARNKQGPSNDQARTKQGPSKDQGRTKQGPSRDQSRRNKKTLTIDTWELLCHEWVVSWFCVQFCVPPAPERERERERCILLGSHMLFSCLQWIPSVVCDSAEWSLDQKLFLRLDQNTKDWTFPEPTTNPQYITTSLPGYLTTSVPKTYMYNNRSDQQR